MWIALFDPYNHVRSLDTVIKMVRDDYDASLEVELASAAAGSYSFRHAVCIVDENGKHYEKSDAVEELAGNLLSEYGLARGGQASDICYEKWDFGWCHAWAMEFVGGPCEPEFETRLKAAPCLPGQTLRDREERYVFAPKPALED